MIDLYFCPTVGEVESASGGGFDVCCSHPELHVPMPATEATAAVSVALSEAKKREFALGQRVRRVRALHGRYRDVEAVGDDYSCAHCNQLAGHRVPWPCPTIQALDGVAAPATQASEGCDYIRERWDGPYRLRDRCAGQPAHASEHGPWEMLP